ERPCSMCNENCHSGSSRTKIDGKPYCCYKCLPCLENRITNNKDMDDCVPCPKGQYPNNNHDSCLLKHIVFLSYEDPLGIILVVVLHGQRNIPLVKCPIKAPLPILHKYYKPGDFIIASITSQVYIFSSPVTFQKPPSEETFDDLLKIPLSKCPIKAPLPIVHKYYQPGDFIIASITSQVYIFPSPVTFQKPPSEEIFDDL
ncbi:hypothetical protein E2320_003352, partial [Naja naja]